MRTFIERTRLDSTLSSENQSRLWNLIDFWTLLTFSKNDLGVGIGGRIVGAGTDIGGKNAFRSLW